MKSKILHHVSSTVASIYHATVGASLSEPHTSVPALHTCVCIYACLLAWTDHLLNERIIFHDDRCHEACEGMWRATVRVQRRGPRAKTTEIEVRVALVCTSTDDGRPLIGGTNFNIDGG